MLNSWDMLNVNVNSTPEEVRAVWLSRVKSVHPDKVPDGDSVDFLLLKDAYTDVFSKVCIARDRQESAPTTYVNIEPEYEPVGDQGNVNAYFERSNCLAAVMDHNPTQPPTSYEYNPEVFGEPTQKFEPITVDLRTDAVVVYTPPKGLGPSAAYSDYREAHTPIIYQTDTEYGLQKIDLEKYMKDRDDMEKHIRDGDAMSIGRKMKENNDRVKIVEDRLRSYMKKQS